MSSSKNPSASGSSEPPAFTRRGFVGMAALAVGSIPVLSACAGSSTSASGRSPGTPKKGGVLHVGITSGGSSETLDPNKLYNVIDGARIAQVYDTAYTLDERGLPVPAVAEELNSVGDGTRRKLRIRDGVTFHNGRPLTAADVAWSYNYAMQSSNGAYGRGFLLGAGVTSTRALDKTTVEIDMSKPNYMLEDWLSLAQLSIFPNGTHPGEGGKFIGSGPFKLERFTPGERAVFTTYPNYWSQKPYLDGLEIISVTDPSALANAVQTGQVDAAASIDYELLATFQKNPQFTVYNGPSGTCNAHAMRTQTAPYNDPRVRKAMRLLVDREQQLTNGASGQGKIANDLFTWYDPYYASNIPQISYDPEQATSLLKAAGMESATFQLYTTNGVPGVVASATLLQSSAKKAGVNVQVINVPSDSYLNNVYLKKPFYSVQWPGEPIAQMWTEVFTPAAGYPETQWNNAQWTALFNQALASSDAGRRKTLMVEAQQVLHDLTGYIIPVFLNQSDVARSNVVGLKAGPASPLGGFDFRGVWLRS